MVSVRTVPLDLTEIWNNSEILVYSQVTIIRFLFFDLTYTMYWCKIFKWAVSDSGSTGALQALGKSSILLRSTILN